MTREELNSFVDTNVTNKTVAQSLTPVDEGEAIKKVADYVDEQLAEFEGITAPILKTIKVSLTSAEILDLYTTPKVIIPAEEGKIFVPAFLFQKYTHVTTAYTTSGLFRLIMSPYTYANFTPIITSNDNAQAMNTFGMGWASSGVDYTGLGLQLQALTANPTGGNGTLELYITYYEITL
jgi:hypothetical protein